MSETTTSPAVWLAGAQMLGELGLSEAARELYADLEASDARSARLGRAVIDLRDGDAGRASTGFVGVLAQDPADADAMLGLGLAQLRMDQPTDALATMARARTLGADEAAVCLALGQAHLTLGQLELAEDALGVALRLCPDNAGVRLDMARCQSALGDDIAAALTLLDGLTLAPHDLRQAQALIALLDGLGDAESALAVTAFCARIRGAGDPELLHRWALAALELGHLEEAHEATTLLADAVEPTAPALLELSKLFAVSGDVARAITCADACIAADDTLSEALYFRSFLVASTRI